MDQLVQNYLQHYYLPWNQDIFSSLSPLSLFYNEKNAIKQFKSNPGWDISKQRHPQGWIDAIKKNMDLSNFPNYRKRGITINQTPLRLLPTKIPSFGDPKKAGQGFPFDNLQVSSLDANIPLYIVHTTADGAWDFVITPSTAVGWVQVKDVTLVTQQFIDQWKKSRYDYLVPIKENFAIKGVGAHYFFSTRIGALYPLVKRERRTSKILVATSDADGMAVVKIAEVSNKIAHTWPLSASSKNIAQLADHFLGLPYGWGGLYGYRDCSLTIRDLFAPFAIWLPRHSTQQAETGIVNDIANKTSEDKKQLILRNGIPFFTLLWVHGHILLYIGQWNNEIVVFHDPWGVHTENKFHQEGRLVIGKTVITPLSLGKGYLTVPKTWLDQVNSYTLLVPPQQLAKENIQELCANSATANSATQQSRPKKN